MLRRPFQRGPQAAVVLLAIAAALAPSARGSATAPSRASARAAAFAGVTVSPLPGTPDASPSTQVSFLGGPGTKVARVRVTGSRSGDHSGTLEAYSTGTGESFIPSRPFDPGERVSVSAEVTGGSPAAVVRTSFTVAREAPVTGAEFPAQPGTPADVVHFRSAPTLTPSSVQITTPAGGAATPGDLFLAPYQGSGTPGPMIVDQAGNLIWFHPLPAGDSSTNFRPQTYNGKTVLTWWQGRILKLGFGQGEDEIYNTSYQPIAHVLAGNGYHADLHEFLLTPQGTAWIDAFDPVDFDLRGVGGSARGVVTDSIVQEIDVKTGLVMWEWHALGHLALRDSYSVMPHGSHPWDYAHVNSIDPSVPGQLLLSSRNTWTVFDVDLHTGALIWRIGGRQSSFRAGPRTVFRFQHDAAWQPGGLISLFDNGYVVDGDTQSRGLLLDPNSRTRRVTLVKQFANPNEKLLTASQGDLLRLPGGNWLMGYGGLPNFTEYDSSGKVLLDGTLGPGVEDYRSYLAPWSGQPTTRPSIAAQPGSAGGVTVETSWNGATAVAAWQVLAGPSPSALAPAATVAASGFETTIQLATPAAYVAVAALAGSGATLATSTAIAPSA
jgi:hypothetical protein